jgi:hypothetical protein
VNDQGTDDDGDREAIRTVDYRKASLDVIDRHRDGSAFRLARSHRFQQVGCQRGNAVLAGQIVVPKRCGSNAGVQSPHLRGILDNFANFQGPPSIAVGNVLALDTARFPWHRGEAFRADCLFAIEAGSKMASVNSD